MHHFRPPYVAFGVVPSVAVAAMAITATAPPALTLTASTGPCGNTGNLTGSTCTYTASGSSTFTVPGE